MKHRRSYSFITSLHFQCPDINVAHTEDPSNFLYHRSSCFMNLLQSVQLSEFIFTLPIQQSLPIQRERLYHSVSLPSLTFLLVSFRHTLSAPGVVCPAHVYGSTVGSWRYFNSIPSLNSAEI